MTLADLLGLPRLNPIERARLAAAVSHVAALSPETLERLRQLGITPPQPVPGNPLLLAAIGQEGSLWRVEQGQDPQAVELGAASRAAWELSLRVAARSLPILGSPRTLRVTRPPRVCRITHGAQVESITGPSVGLAFALLHVSNAAALPIAANFACSASIDSAGRLGPVELIEQKVAALRDWAPGVSRLLVAAEQATFEAPPGLTVLRAATLQDACSLAFPALDFEAALREVWRDPELATRAAEELFRFVMEENHAPIRWEAVERAAAILSDQAPPNAQWHASVARSVAARHAGLPHEAHLPPPPGPPPRRPHRLKLLAQRLQTATDAGFDAWEGVARAAEAEVAPPREEHMEDLEVLGSLGRLFASRCQWAQAVSPLERAALGWCELARDVEMARPVCELLRVAGLTRNVGLAQRARDWALRCAADPRTSDTARTYLQLELGRSFVLLGEHEAAARALAMEAARWEEAAVHTRASRLRWLARLPGDTQAFPELERFGAQSDTPLALPFLLLAQADHGHHAALDQLPPTFARLFLLGVKGEPDAGLARHLDIFPY